MLEMYVPDLFKFPSKCMKWGGGCVFYGVAAFVDHTTSGFKKKFFGEELPIDAPQLMGALPEKRDIDNLRKFIKEMEQARRALMRKSTLNN